jgi:lincosamide nucleotidyltransferase A/C/D/E
MEANDVKEIYADLEKRGIRVWLDGGWGVDALLETQTRYHKDLDIIVRDTDVEEVKRVLGRDGFEVTEGTATSFVLTDTADRSVDVHVVRFDTRGDGVYRMQNGQEWIYPAEGFSGEGKILDMKVRCLSPAAQMLCHTGYEIKAKDIREMELLKERFGVDFPDEHAHRCT